MLLVLLRMLLVDCIIFTAVPKPEIDFAGEIATKTDDTATNLASVDDLIIMSETKQSFIENVSLHMTKENIRDI